MITRIVMGGILVLALVSLWVAGAEGGAASSSWQGATVVPPPVGTVQPPPGTPNRTVYPTTPPQGTSGSGREFDDPTFERLWRRTDWPVHLGRVKRSFFWGPGSLTEKLTEEYTEGMGGWRAVQYFDKARMEINNSNANRNDPFFVTNGLLAVELITGEMQVGNTQFRLRWPAEINIASDPDDPLAPTYASFRGAYARTNDHERADKIVNARIDRQGHLDFEFGGVGYANLDRFGVRNVHFSSATLHNIPNVFWDFLNAHGLVYVNSISEFRTEQIIQPWYYATGYPITDAYWAQVKIEGKEGTWVLIQPYQRRVLTYVPTAPEGFKVQMGNIGQHYYDWRYKEVGKPPALRDGCANGYPMLGFGKVYNSSTRMKIDLGCQMRREDRLTVRRQRFEGGEVLGVVRLDSYTDRYHEDVFMLLKDGTVATAPFLIYNPVPAPAPNSVPEPSGNFLIAMGSIVQSAGVRLGKALSHVETWEFNPTTRVGGAPVQFFQGGLMVYPSAAEKKIYVLRSLSGHAHKQVAPHIQHVLVDRWAVFEDTFVP